ncbi:cell division protein ZapA [Litorivivens lipolytica]|uniref:Cell division protein ZapA n=1 Tax=Litorivivens lipolytica TaxID=1524264 RepID=A0A7W4W6K2_9GAMM|nr:cell division protein ZapA [Litorivivens lipolytica]MBB3048396.1 cell division protein ZapA [Litorivivens lipolytica]
MSQNTVVVRIMDKEFQVACPPDQEPGLHQAAARLDKQMREIRSSGKVIGLERIAIMVALNTTYELLNGSNEPSKAEQDSIKRVNEKLEDALHKLRQLEIN